MDEIKANIERIEGRMAQSQAAWEVELRRQARGISQLELGQGNLAAGQRGLAEGQRSLAEAVRQLALAVDRIDAVVARLDESVAQHGLAVRELRRSNTNLREASSAYRQESDQMFGQLKAAVFVLETSTDLRFERVEARLDELERRPPAA